jgi:hypothetical protein
MTDREPGKRCCRDFERAMVGGTDNEGWGALVREDNRAGYDLPDMQFCPWCGTALQQERNDGREEGRRAGVPGARRE